MPDTHVPLDEEVEKRFNSTIAPYLLSRMDGLESGKQREINKIKEFLAQELAYLKHTICVEIEELKKNRPKPKMGLLPLGEAEYNRFSAMDQVDGYNQAIKDALSVKSLKESE